MEYFKAITKTRFKELGITKIDRDLWRYVDLTTDYDDVAREGLCVPAKGLPTRYWEQEPRIMASIYQMERRSA